MLMIRPNSLTRGLNTPTALSTRLNVISVKRTWKSNSVRPLLSLNSSAIFSARLEPNFLSTSLQVGNLPAPSPASPCPLLFSRIPRVDVRAVLARDPSQRASDRYNVATFTAISELDACILVWRWDLYGRLGSFRSEVFPGLRS